MKVFFLNAHFHGQTNWVSGTGNQAASHHHQQCDATHKYSNEIWANHFPMCPMRLIYAPYWWMPIHNMWFAIHSQYTHTHTHIHHNWYIEQSLYNSVLFSIGNNHQEKNWSLFTHIWEKLAILYTYRHHHAPTIYRRPDSYNNTNSTTNNMFGSIRVYSGNNRNRNQCGTQKMNKKRTSNIAKTKSMKKKIFIAY